MANEFIARNGVIARSNSEITGSLKITQGVTASLFGTASWATNLVGGAGSSITIADEGASQGTATFLNFIGNTVTATVASNTASLTVSTGSTVATVAGTVNQITINGGITALNGAVTIALPLTTSLGVGSSFTATSLTGSIISASNHISGGQIVAVTGFTGSISSSGLKGAILNTQLQNSSVTVGSTAISLGASSTTIGGLVSLSSTSITASIVSASSFTGSISSSYLVGDIVLGTQTTGSFVATLTQGTGVTITGLTAEGSNPTIAIGQAVGTTANVQFNQITGSIVSASNHISGGQIVATTGFTGSISASGLRGAILNTQLQNSSVTIGSTAISLGGTSTTLSGLTQISTTGITGSISATNNIVSASALSSTTQGVITQTINGVATSTNITDLQTTSNPTFANLTLTGNAKLGDAITDFHTVTGSLGISGSVFITGSTQITGSLNVLGVINATGDITAFGTTSDIRYKTNIVSIENSINKITSISGVYFDWIEDLTIHPHKGKDIGVLAQDVEKVLPEVVSTRDNGVKAVKYEKIVPVLIECIKQLQKEIEILKNDIQNIKNNK